MCWTQTKSSTEPKSQTIAYMMGRPRSLGGRTSPRKRGERSATGKNRGNDGGGCRNTGDADQDPKRLAQVDDVEEPAQENAEDRECGDDHAKRSGQRINDALQQALDRGKIDALGEGRFGNDQKEDQAGNE